jgi:hypothetical protein
MRIFVEGDPEEHPEEIASLIHQLLMLSNIDVTVKAPPFRGIQHAARVARELPKPISVEHFTITRAERRGKRNDR